MSEEIEEFIEEEVEEVEVVEDDPTALTDEELDNIADTAIAALKDVLKYFNVGEVTIDEYEGVLPFDDKVSPEIIRREMGLSKNAFKRAVGHLMKVGRAEIRGKRIYRV